MTSTISSYRQVHGTNANIASQPGTALINQLLPSVRAVPATISKIRMWRIVVAAIIA
jgi:hypothetical protein